MEYVLADMPKEKQPEKHRSDSRNPNTFITKLIKRLGFENKSKFKRRAVALAFNAVVISTVLLSGTAMGQSSSSSSSSTSTSSGGDPAGPTAAVQDAVNTIATPIANIGALVLFIYGIIMLVKAGVEEETSNPLKKIGIAWGIALVLQSYGQIQSWLISI